MTTPFLCVFLAFLLIYFPRIFVLTAQARQPGGYDNLRPRDQQAKLEGWGRRANAAHANAFEAFAPFAASVIIAHLCSADAQWSAILAVTFVAARTVYPLLYLADLGWFRTAVWFVGMGAVLGLFGIALFQ